MSPVQYINIILINDSCSNIILRQCYKYVENLLCSRNREAGIVTCWLRIFVARFCCCGCYGLPSHVYTMALFYLSRSYWNVAAFVQVDAVNPCKP